MSHRSVDQESAFRKTSAEVNLKSLQHNFYSLRSLVSEDEFFCPMVKANAYGHGDIQVAKSLASWGASFLGVALIEEGIRLRQNQVLKPHILVFANFDMVGAEALVKNHLTPVVSRWSEFEYLKKANKGNSPLRIHLKFDTGMGRLGFGTDQAEKIYKAISQDPELKLEGICSHLAKGEDCGDKDSFSQKQFENFSKVLKCFKGLAKYKHILNSAGLIATSVIGDSKLGPVGARPGLSIYGIWPDFNSSQKAPLAKIELKPVLRLTSEVSMIQSVSKGDGVSYNHNWVAQRDSILGVVPIGYGDGYLRESSPQAQVLVRGHRVEVCGTICMDYLMIDLTDLSSQVEDFVGEEVVLIGTQGQQEITAQDLAQWARSISYVVTTSLQQRVPRTYLSEGGHHVS